jgi:hypothetical protein
MEVLPTLQQMANLPEEERHALTIDGRPSPPPRTEEEQQEADWQSVNLLIRSVKMKHDALVQLEDMQMLLSPLLYAVAITPSHPLNGLVYLPFADLSSHLQTVLRSYASVVPPIADLLRDEAAFIQVVTENCQAVIEHESKRNALCYQLWWDVDVVRVYEGVRWRYELEAEEDPTLHDDVRLYDAILHIIFGVDWKVRALLASTAGSAEHGRADPPQVLARATVCQSSKSLPFRSGRRSLSFNSPKLPPTPSRFDRADWAPRRRCRSKRRRIAPSSPLCL